MGKNKDRDNVHNSGTQPTLSKPKRNRGFTKPQKDALAILERYDGVKVEAGIKSLPYKKLVEMGFARVNRMRYKGEWITVYSLNKKEYTLYKLKNLMGGGYEN